MLHSRNLVSRCAIILSDLGLDYNLRIEFIRYNKIRRLVEAHKSLRTLGLAKAYFCDR